MTRGGPPYLNGKDRKRRRAALLRRDGPLCHWCRTADGTTLDHVIPKALGGTWALTNLVLACFDCNQARGLRLHRSLPPERRDPRGPSVSHP